MRSGLSHVSAADRAQARARRLLEQAGQHEEHAHALYHQGMEDAAELALGWSCEAIGKALLAVRLSQRLRAEALREVRRG